MYVLGGYDLEGMTLQSVEYLDEHNGSWHVSYDMPSGLYFRYKHFIYVFGGFFLADVSHIGISKQEVEQETLFDYYHDYNILHPPPRPCMRITPLAVFMC